MNAEICKKCNRCSCFFYLDSSYQTICLTKDSFWNLTLNNNISSYILDRINKNIDDKKIMLKSTHIGDDDFNEIIKLLKADNKNCIFYAEHELYDLNKN